MNTIKTSILSILLLPVFCFGQNHKWLYIYRNSVNFNPLPLNEIIDISHSNDSQGNILMTITKQNDTDDIPVTDINRCVIGNNVPAMYIVTPESPNLDNLIEKDVYLDALISIDGAGVCEDLEPTPARIKGRGNATWTYPKKPYRIKFETKTSILGFDKQKNYVVIANYIDCSNMRNALAFEIARLLNMPFSNHIQPIRLYFNGKLKGSFFVTEKIGISKTSVNIDESKGVLFELDTHYDETYKFTTPIYKLPVMIKDPDLDEISVSTGIEANEALAEWQSHFEIFEKAVANDTFIQMVDLQSLVNYLLVYNLCGNREINWPKSVFIYRCDNNDVYHFGPVWDFDWAFTYNNGYEDKSPEMQLLTPWTPLLGQPFFKKMCRNKEFMQLYRETWEDFIANKYPLLLDYIDEYARQIEPSVIENGTIWPSVEGTSTSSFFFAEHHQALRSWLDARVKYLSVHPNLGLYDS